MVLRPPVQPMLAQASELIPPVRPLASKVAYEQKFDRCRVLVFTAAGPGGRVLLQIRRGALVQGAFPDLVAAAERLPPGLVLDGELVVWDSEASALSFEGLRRRAPAAPAAFPRWPRSCRRSLWRSTSCSSTAGSCSTCLTWSAAPAWRPCSPTTL